MGLPKIYWILLLVCLSPRLTMDEAIRIALESNGRLRVADAQLGEAEEVLEEARGSRLPRVDLSETFVRTTNPTLVFSNLLGQEQFGPANFAIDALNEPDALSNFNTRISIEQPIWIGGKIRHGIHAASSMHDAGTAGRERTRQEVIYQVVESWTGAVLALAQLEVAEEALKTAGAHVELVRDLHEGGLVVASDLLQAQVRRSEIEEMKIRAEGAVEVSMAAVNLSLGRNLDTPFTPDRSMTLGVSEPEPTLAELLDEAVRARPDLKAIDHQVEASRQSERVERGARLPEIAVAGNLEANDEQPFDFGGTNWSVFAGARIRLFEGGRIGSKIRQAEWRTLAAEEQQKLFAHTVELDVRRAFHALRSSRKRLQQAEQSVVWAREGLRIVEDRYKEGLTTLVELLDAETSLTRARTREVAARRDIVLTLASLDLAVGRLDSE